MAELRANGWCCAPMAGCGACAMPARDEVAMSIDDAVPLLSVYELVAGSDDHVWSPGVVVVR